MNDCGNISPPKRLKKNKKRKILNEKYPHRCDTTLVKGNIVLSDSTKTNVMTSVQPTFDTDIQIESRSVSKVTTLPPIKRSSTENHSSINLHRRDPCLLCDVTHPKCFRNVPDKSYRLANNGRGVLGSRSRERIKAENGSISVRLTDPADCYDTPAPGYLLPPVIMSSLKLDNRQDMAANDHVRHHLKRQEQWIHTERLKNWRRTNGNRITRRPAYQHSSSSGQKSDVNSGNSAESFHTQSSSSSDPHHPVMEEMDEEQKQAINKCLRWMEHLPKKFSGMHIIVPAPDSTDQS